MFKTIRCAFALLCCFFLHACTTASPEKYFDVAVLNSNMIIGFANEGMTRELESPPLKIGRSKDEIIPMPRKELVADRIQFVEENLEKLRTFDPTGDRREMIKASLELHEFILPVLKKEYAELARLYDSGASSEATGGLASEIHLNYFNRFETLYGKLLNIGKAYASKHHIQVQWRVS